MSFWLYPRQQLMVGVRVGSDGGTQHAVVKMGGHICPLLLFLGQQNLLLPIKAPPNLVASAVILIIYRGWAQQRGSSAAHGVSWASPPSWYLPSGVSTDMAGTSLTFLSLGSLSSSGGQNSFKSSSGLHGRHSRRTNPNA